MEQPFATVAADLQSLLCLTNSFNNLVNFYNIIRG